MFSGLNGVNINPLTLFTQILKTLDKTDGQVDGKMHDQELLNNNVFGQFIAFDIIDDKKINGSIFNNEALAGYTDELNLRRTRSDNVNDYARVEQYRGYLENGGSVGNGSPVGQNYLYSTLMDDDYLDRVIPEINSIEGARHAYIPGANFGQQSSVTQNFMDGNRSQIINSGVTLTSDFGPRESPGGIGSTNHKGIDIGVAQGTPLMAPFGGVVKFARERGGYGNLVIIDHGNGRETRYGHMSELNVTAGQRIEAGYVIGKSGGTPGTTGAGTSTGAHLHFEYRENGVALDPLQHGFDTFFNINV